MISLSNFNSKSISKLNFDGSIDINLSPSEYSTFWFIFIILIGSSLISKPDEIIFSIKFFAEPSKIGTSSLSISTSTLSIPKPNNAPIKCSIVETFTPYSFSIVVFKDVLVTFKKFG